MAYTIIGTQYKERNKFDYMNNDPYYQKISKEDYIKTMGSLNGYWNAVDSFNAMRVTELTNGKGFGINLSDYKFVPKNTINEITKNKSAYDTLNNILNNGQKGSLLTFDVETIGNFNDSVSVASNIPTITEIGVSVKNFNGAKAKSFPNASFVFGINQDTKEWLEDALDKMIKGEEITNDQMIGLERASRYSTIMHDGHQFRWQKGTFEGKKVKLMTDINISNQSSVEDIRSGINNLSEIYSESDAKSFEYIANRISNFAKEDNRVVAGQNLSFDIDAINKNSKLLGVSSKLDFEYVDTYTSAQFISEHYGKSTGEIPKMLNPYIDSANAKLETFSQALLPNSGETAFHFAYDDVITTENIILSKKYGAPEIVSKLAKKIPENGESINIKDKYFRIESEGQNRQKDLVLINDNKQVITSYNTTGTPMKIDGVGYGADFEGFTITKGNENVKLLEDEKNKVVLKMSSLNGDVSLYKSFDTTDDLGSFLQNNGKIISQREAEKQLAIHDKDVARRVIDGFFDPGYLSVYKSGEEIIESGGFSELSNYYNAYKKLASLSEDAISSIGIDGVSTKDQLIKSLSNIDNLEKVYRYSQENNIPEFEKLFNIRKSMTDAGEIVRHNYSNTSILPNVFDAIDRNAGFIDYSINAINNSNISNTNLAKTIALRSLKEEYMAGANIDSFIEYTSKDLDNVSVLIGDKYSNINISNIEKATSRLTGLARRTGNNNKLSSVNTLTGVIDDLIERQLLTEVDKENLLKSYGDAKSPFLMAQGIVSRLNKVTEELRKKDPDELREEFLKIQNKPDSELTYDELVLKYKNHKTISESSVSDFMLTENASVTEDFKKKASEIIKKSEAMSISANMLDDQSPEQLKLVTDQLLEMGYSKNVIKEKFEPVFYSKGNNSKINIKRINRDLKEKGLEEVRSMFYRGEGENASGFLIFTPQSNYNKVLDTLNSLDKSSSSMQIKEAIQDMASYREIPIIKRLNVTSDDGSGSIIKKITGHAPQSAIVQKGNYKTATTLGVEFWSQTEMINGIEQTIYKGRFTDQGDEYLAGFRPVTSNALEAVANKNFKSATRTLNNDVDEMMALEGTISENFGFTEDYRVIKGESPGPRMLANAYKISLGMEGVTYKGSSEQFDVLGIAMKVAENSNLTDGSTDEYSKALVELQELFNRKYKIANRGVKNDTYSIFSDWHFKEFFGETFTNQTGGIGSEPLVQQYVRSNPNSALAKLKNKSMLDIITGAINNNDMFDKSVKEIFTTLQESGLNAVTSSSMYEHGTFYIDNFNDNRLYGSPTAPMIRGNTIQRQNGETFKRNDKFFYNADALEKNLGMRIGELETSKEFNEFIKNADEYYYGAESLTREGRTHRNMVGVLTSISESELKNKRDDALKRVLRKTDSSGLDKKITEKIFNEMYDTMHFYEGSAYARPSLANNPLFKIEDTKTWKAGDVFDVLNNGTEEEIDSTKNVLKSLVGKKIENGDIIGYRSIEGKLRPIGYKGRDIAEFTQTNFEEILEYGRTKISPDKQLDSFKIFAGFEKGTVISYDYFKSIDKEQASKEIIEKMTSLGFGADEISNDLYKNIETMNKYTDMIMDVVSPTGNRHKTAVIMNVNTTKHLTDLSVETVNNLIAYEFSQSEDSFNKYVSMLKDSNNKDLVKFADTIHYDNINKRIIYDTFEINGSTTIQESIVNELRKSDLKEAKRVIRDISDFENFNGAFVSIQRQSMTPFEGEKFKMDQRFYQGISFQTIDFPDKEIRESGEKYVETVRSRITSGYYDSNIANIDDFSGSVSNKLWRDIVKRRRGILRPYDKQQQLAGLFESINFINDNFDISDKNILKIKATDILDQIPEGGINTETLGNFLFKVNGELPDFLKSFSQSTTNSIITDAHMSSFYLDFGKEIKYNEKTIRGVLLPIQNVIENNGEYYTSSTYALTRFLNGLKENLASNDDKKIENALNELFDSFTKEFSGTDKTSLLNKATMNLVMPGSHGAKSTGAIVPTLIEDVSDSELIKKLENEIAKTNNIEEIKEKSLRLNSLYEKRNALLSNQKNIIIETENISELEKALNLTGNSGLNFKYILSEDNKTLETSALISKQMFKNTDLDTSIVGRQIANDYFKNGKITKYDSFSKITRKAFEISSDEFDDIFKKLHTTFDTREYGAWLERTEQAINNVMNDSQVSIVNRRKEALNVLNANFNNLLELNSGDLIKQENILKSYNNIYDSIGTRYLKEVGILGDAGRFPFFHDRNILPTRFYLSDNLKGNNIRFLGPMFSLFENVDFDGDSEFIKLFSNGGLLNKEDEEYKLLKTRFKYLNKDNREAFAAALEDSIKTYRYSDQKSYKAEMLKAFKKDWYDIGKEEFIGSLTPENKKWFNGLGDNMQDFIVNHSVQIQQQFRAFDKEHGIAMLNPDIVKAAIRAVGAKELIGQYSKPNLEIRNTIKTLLDVSKTEEERNKLIRIKENLFSLNEKMEPSGILTDLEQKGIDTKHVKDAIFLNTSPEWNAGVYKMFNGYKKGTFRTEEELSLLVSGSRKLYFSSSEESDLDIAKSILRSNLDEIEKSLSTATGDTQDILLGKKYIRSIYDLSKIEGASDAFYSAFRKAKAEDILSVLEGISDPERKGKDLSLLAIDNIKNIYEIYKTDELLSVSFSKEINNIINGKLETTIAKETRALKPGDLLFYMSDPNKGAETAAYMYDGIFKEGDILSATFREYDIKQKKSLKNQISVQGTTIADINKQIKKIKRNNVNGEELEFSLLNIKNTLNNQNINLRIGDEAINSMVDKAIGEEVTYNLLSNVMLHNNSSVENALSSSLKVSLSMPEYVGGKEIGNIVGEVFNVEGGININSLGSIKDRLNYAVSKGYIVMPGNNRPRTGSELIKSINREIAKNPRKNVGRISGSTSEEILLNYLGKDVSIYGNKEWISGDISSIQSFNNTQESIEKSKETIQNKLKEVASNFQEELSNFEEAKEAYSNIISGLNKETYDVIRKQKDPYQSMLKLFNFDSFKVDKDFIIDEASVKIKDGISSEMLGAKVAFGRFINTKLEDLSKEEVRYILNKELTEDAFKALKEGTIEFAAAKNTETLLKEYVNFAASNPEKAFLDFSSEEALKATAKSTTLSEAERLKIAAEELIENSPLGKIQKDLTTEGKKKIFGDGFNIKDIFKNMSPETKKGLKIGGAVLGGLAGLRAIAGIANGGAKNKNVEVPVGMEEQDVPMPKYQSDMKYPNAPTEAKNTSQMRRKQMAPRSKGFEIPFTRTLYHDKQSGFDFRVSAETKKALTSQSYQNIAMSAGTNNNSLHVSKDNSKITNNWLENKFSDLME